MTALLNQKNFCYEGVGMQFIHGIAVAMVMFFIVAECFGAEISNSERRSATVSLMMPQPISETELRRWSYLLNASEAQRHHLFQLYDQYLSDEAELAVEHIVPMVRYFNDLRANGDIGRTPRLAEEFDSLVNGWGGQVDRRLIAVEQHLFDTFREHLTPTQQSMLDNIVRLRRWTRYVHEERVPGGGTDLLAFITDEILRSDEIWHPIDPEAFSQLADQYTQTAVGLLQSRRQAHLATRTRGVTHFSRMNAFWEPNHDQQSIEQADSEHNKLSTLRHKLARVEKQISEWNYHMLELFCETLPDESATHIHRMFMEHAYPAVYPDPSRLADLASVSCDEISEEDKALLDQIIATVETRQDAINASMRRKYMDWRYEFARTRSFRHDLFRHYQSKMEELDRQRRALAKRTLEILHESLSNDSWLVIAANASELERQIAEAELNVDPSLAFGEH